MNYLLDTCILSETVKPGPDAGVVEWLSQVDEGRLYLSVIAIGEIQQGISRLPPSRRQQRLQNWLEQDLTRRFAGRVLDIDAETALEWGRVSGKAMKDGAPCPVVDGLLAATALRHNLTLVTRNFVDFERLGVKLFDPFAPR